MNEYPKALYLAGDPTTEQVIVCNAGDEAAKRAAGYRVAYEPQKESETPKRTRKAKE